MEKIQKPSRDLKGFDWSSQLRIIIEKVIPTLH